MSNIINLNGFINDDYNDQKLVEIANYYNKTLKDNLIVKNFYSSENFMYFVGIINLTNERLDINKAESKKFCEFLNKYISNSKEQEADKLVDILSIYYFYNVYGDKFLSLDGESIKLSIYLLSSFEDDNSLKDLKDIISFLFDKNLNDRIHFLKMPFNMKVHLLENPIEEYLYNKTSPKTLNMYINEEIDRYTKDKIIYENTDKVTSVSSIEEAYSYIKDSVTLLCAMLTDTGAVENLSLANYFYNNLENFILKYNMLSNENKIKCMETFNSIISSDEYNLINRIKLIFDELNNFNKKIPFKN